METNDKARFFAMYIDCCESQIESYIPSIHDINKHYNILLYLDKINNSSLLLKPLSLISDEDFTEIMFKKYPYQPSSVLQRGEIIEEHLNQEQVDFLRSKGYALPWMQYSVEDLIQMNWIKLKED